MNLTDALRECALDLLSTEARVDVGHLVDCAEVRYPEAFDPDEAERLRQAAIRRQAKSVLRALADDDDDHPGQARLPGLDFPTAIAVPAEVAGNYYYVRADKATWDQLQAGRHIRDLNVARAQERLDSYDESLETVRPYMEHDRSLTAADAVRLMGES